MFQSPKTLGCWNKTQSSLNRTSNDGNDWLIRRYKTDKSGSKSKMKNYRRLINYYQ